MFKILIIMKKYEKSIARKGGKKMTRKDFIKLAESLGVFQYHMASDPEELGQEYENLVDNIKHICKSTNNDFDNVRFDNAIDKAFTNLDMKKQMDKDFK